MVQCNFELEDRLGQSPDPDPYLNKNGFHLSPSNDRESDTGSMMSKYKIDLMFTIDKKNTKKNVIRDALDDGDEMQIENKVQEKIDQMFKDIALNDMMRNFFVDYLGSIQLNSDVIHSLETLQDPLKKLYISYKKEKQMKITNKKSVLEITKNGLKLTYGNKLEQVNSFSTICVWASVKLITRPHGMNKAFGLEYCFVPLVADYKSNNVKYIKLDKSESLLFPKNTYDDNIPIFVVVMKKMCTTKILEAHAFICKSNDEAINIAANLYKTLLLTSNKNKSKIRQKNGITSCISVNDSLKGSLSRVNHVVNNHLVDSNVSSRGSVGDLDVNVGNKMCKTNKVESVVKEIENRVNKSSVAEVEARVKERKARDRRSSSVESTKALVTDSKKVAPSQSGSTESVRQYVDYVSEAVKRRRNSVLSSVSSVPHRASSVESVDYRIESKPQPHNFSRYNSTDAINAEILDRKVSSKKHTRGSTESLRRNLRANSVESIMSYNHVEVHPELPMPKRKHSNFSMVSCNAIENSTHTESRQRRKSCDVLKTSNNEFFPNESRPHSGVLGSRRTSTNVQNSMNRSRTSSINYLNISSSSVNTMNEFDPRILPSKRRVSKQSNGNSVRRDSFNNETSSRKSRQRQKSGDNVNESNKETKNGDILTKVAIPRSTSFLKTNSSSRNSLNYVKSPTVRAEPRKTSSCKLGLNEIFLELKHQEGLNNLDDILDVILNADGMSFNDLKPIYKEFIVKLALILTKDEFHDKCKIIMSKQRKRRKKMKRKKVLNRFINSELNSLLSCGKKKISRKTSIYKNTLLKRRTFAKRRKQSKILRPKDEKSMLLNDRYTSSGYFTYSECTYNTDSCTCVSAEKCYCTNSSRGISMSPQMTLLPHHKYSMEMRGKPSHTGKASHTMSSTFPNYNSAHARYSDDQHCYHCLRYKSQQRDGPRDKGQICDCDTEYCNASDKCYCNMTSINMIDMLKLQGFAASDTSLDSFRSDYGPTTHNWKFNLLKKPGKSDKQYIQPSKSLEFVQFYGNEGTMDSRDPSTSSFSYKDVGDSEESSALDYNLFHKAKEKTHKHENKYIQGEPQRENKYQGEQHRENKFLVVSARDPKGRIIYMGADKKHNSDPISIKKTAEIAALFPKKYQAGYHELKSGVTRRSRLENSLGYLP